MTGPQDPPPGVDPSQPSPARVYDFLLGGTDHYDSDRAAGEMLKSLAPDMVDSAFANRSYHRRAARWIARQGVRQFIDIGSGLPTAGNTHDVVREIEPTARVAYVDNDPLVLAYGSHLLANDDDAAVILGDLRHPDEVLGNAQLREVIDLSEPVGVLVTAVLHFVSEDWDPYALMARYAAAIAPGSYLSLSHMTADSKPPQAVQALIDLGLRSGDGAFLRSRDQFRRFFDGLELVPPYAGAEPDVTWVGLWDCDDPAAADSEGSRWLYCGVARRP